MYYAGGPGSGKGTQCDLLVAEFSFTHLSTGDLLRDEVNKDTELAVKLKETMDRGELVTSVCMLLQGGYLFTGVCLSVCLSV